MMWRLFNLILDWDYIQVGSKMYRIKTNPEGKVYYIWDSYYENGITEIISADQVFWLTCKPGKYLFI